MTDEDTQRVEHIALADLRLDPANPRLPPEMQEPPKSQRQIALYINKHYDPLRIAESIADHRFFESEPLIAVRDTDGYLVIEGNRRLTALMGLADDDLRAEFAKENSGWKRLDSSHVPATVPVLVVQQPQDVAALLGYRHISGIEPWDPYAQARYISLLVNRDGYSLEQVAELVGRTRTEVASKYRDFDILRQADELGLDTRRARKSFGVFNNAMGRRAIRSFIGAPDPRSVDPDYWPLAESNRDKLETLLVLMFGNSQGQGRVISDSRQLGQLSTVLAESSGRALKVLQTTGDLQDSLDAAQNPTEQFSRALKVAEAQLEKATNIDPATVSPSTLGSLEHIASLVQRLRDRHNRGEDT